MTDREYRRLMKTPMPPGVYSLQIIRRYFALVVGRELDDEEVRTTIDRINSEANAAVGLDRGA